MNKKWLSHFIAIGALVVFITLGLASASAPSAQWKDVIYSGEDTKILEGNAWAFTISDWFDDRPPIIIDFLSNGKVNGFWGNSSWERVETNVRLVIENGYSLIEGIYNPENNTIIGTISYSDGTKAEMRMELFGVAGTTLYSTERSFSTSGSNGQMLKIGNRLVYFTSIIGYTGNDTNIRIPPIVGDLVVTSIGRGAFNNKNLTSVTFPSIVNAGRNNSIRHQQIYNLVTDSNSPDVDGYIGISDIGDQAFANNHLTSLNFSNFIVRIGAQAFANNKLTSIIIPNSIREIGINAFAGNPITSISIPNTYTSIGEGAFANIQLTSVIIPSSVKAIGSNAFAGNPITNITIQNGLTRIGEQAFANLIYLSNIIIPDSVTHIAGNAFTGSNNLTQISIGSNVTILGNELMPFNFRGAYLANSLRAGTYTFIDGQWIVEFR